MTYDAERVRNLIEKQPQRQDSLDAQIDTLIVAAERLGCYDAQDWLKQLRRHRQAFQAAGGNSWEESA